MKNEDIKKLREVFGNDLKEFKMNLDPQIQKDVSEYISKLDKAHQAVSESKIVFKS